MATVLGQLRHVRDGPGHSIWDKTQAPECTRPAPRIPTWVPRVGNAETWFPLPLESSEFTLVNASLGKHAKNRKITAIFVSI